jgi:ureidoglycolate hydrolase
MIVDHLENYSFVDSQNISFNSVIDYLETDNIGRINFSLRSGKPERPPQDGIFIKSMMHINLQQNTNTNAFSKSEYMTFSSRVNVFDKHPKQFTPVSPQNWDFFLEIVCLMYSQNPDAFQEFIENYSQISETLTTEMQTFYGDIIESQNPVIK